MDSATLINMFISAVLFLAGALMTFGLILLKGMQSDIISIRKRLHLVEGAVASSNAHVEMVNKMIDGWRNIDGRVMVLEREGMRR